MQARKSLAAAFAVAGVAMAATISHRIDSVPAPAGGAAADTSEPGDPGRWRAASGAADMPVPSALTVQGEIAGLAPDAPATATVYVGGRSHAAAVQGSAYSASFTALSDDEMVVVEVASLRARYRSVLGSAGRLAAAAGSDAIATVGERASLRVSPFSTSLAWLVRNGLGGRDAVSDAEFETVTRSIVGQDLANVAYLLAGWAAGTIALPQGYQDGQQVLESPAAYSQVYWATNLAPAMAYLYDQADNVPLDALAQLPDSLAMLGPVPLNEPAMSVSDLQLMVRRVDGDYALFEDEPLLGTPRYSATLTARGEVALSPVAGSGTRTVLRYLPFNLYETLPVHRVSLGHHLRRLVVGEVYSLWASRSTWQDSHHSAAGDYEQQNTEHAIWSAFDLTAAANGLPWAPLLGDVSNWPEYSLPAACSSVQRPSYAPAFGKCAHLTHQFRSSSNGWIYDAGGFDARMQPVSTGNGRSFSYQLRADGSLGVVVVAPGQPTMDSLLWRYAPGTADLLPVVYLARSAEASFVGASVAMRPQPQSWSALGDPVGSWRTPASLALMARYPAPDRNFEIRRYADQSQRDANVYLNGSFSFTPGIWGYPGYGVADYQYRARFPNFPTARHVTDCGAAFAGGATGCAPTRVRHFRPLQRVGARLYGVSDFYSNALLPEQGYTGPYEVQVLDSRADYIECVAGACLASIPPAP